MKFRNIKKKPRATNQEARSKNSNFAKATADKREVRKKNGKTEIATLSSFARDDKAKTNKNESPRNNRIITDPPSQSLADPSPLAKDCNGSATEGQKSIKKGTFFNSVLPIESGFEIIKNKVWGEFGKLWTGFYRSPQATSRMTLDNSLPLVVSVILGVGIVIGLIGTLLVYQQLQTVKQQRQEVVAEISKWQQFEAQHPGYRDGYVKLAMLSYRLGEISNAKNYVEKALTLDPNFAPALELQKKIE